jgi:sigma-B regulation protein RsbU (phosphoserine phosphatase)
MDYHVLLIEAYRGEAPTTLKTALAAIGAQVQVLGADEALVADEYPPLDVLLASAAVPPEMLREIALRTSLGQSKLQVLVFTESQFDDLETHVSHGRDYLVPPFLPRLLRSRLQTCFVRTRLSQTIDETESKARLVAYDRELQIARSIQDGFLPDAIPQPNGWQLKVRFKPARKVAGDFYDAFELANGRRIGFIVADVCDKGVGAALFMALIRSLLRHTAEYSGLQSLVAAGQDFGEPGTAASLAGPVSAVGVTPMLSAIRSTNGYLTRNHSRQGYFATIFFGVLDPATGKLVYINGGHNPPLLTQPGNTEPLKLELTGPAVGVIPDCNYRLGQTVIEKGETLLLYTDGVTEARSSDGSFFGERRMSDIVLESRKSGADMLTRLEADLEWHVGDAEQFDDITLMSVARN